MTYEEALQIAIEELYDRVEYIKAMDKGFPRVKAQLDQLKEAHDMLRKELDKRLALDKMVEFSEKHGLYDL